MITESVQGFMAQVLKCPTADEFPLDSKHFCFYNGKK